MPTMSDRWTSHVERIVFATFARGVRVIGVTGARPESGVSSVCRCIAEAVTRTGRKTLLLDLSGRPDPGPAAVSAAWRPGEGGAGQSIRPEPGGYDRLAATFDAGSRGLFNNIDRLRRALGEDLSQYEAIVVDLPSVPVADQDRLNGAAVAAACDAVVLVCVAGEVSREQVSASLDALANAQAQLLGTVLNDMRNPTLGAEIAREAARFRRYLPRLSGWVERKALASVLLN